MTAAFGATLALSLLAAASCGRRRETIGTIITNVGGADAGNGGAGGAPDAVVSETGGEVGDGAAPEILAAACEPAASAVIPAGSAVTWSCGGRLRCLQETDFGMTPAAFDSAPADTEPTRQPVIVYPLADSVHPVNLARLTLQWRRSPGAGQSAFRIQIAPATGTPYTIYVGRREPTLPTPALESDAIYEIPEPVWRTIASENRGASVSIQVAAYDNVALAVARSPSIAIRFSARPVEGGLHFLTTAGAQAGINRHLFGARAAYPLVPRSPTSGAGDCQGCHSLSRDGATLAYADTYAGNLALVRTADPSSFVIRPKPAPDDADGISPAVSPDGRWLVARAGKNDFLTVYDTQGGIVRAVAPPAFFGGRIDFPEWSPDGASLVGTLATRPTPMGKYYSAVDGQLVRIPWSGAQLGAPELLVSEPNQVHSHPSWSPDGKWIVFASHPTGQETNLNAAARLRLLNVAARQVYELARATVAPGNAATYPKFAPVGQDGCQLLFVAFQSRLQYGVIGRRSADLIWPQLWMTALDLRNLAPGGDPSSPPVWLPFQDVNNKNLLPAWSEAVPCGAAPTCGEGATCAEGRCVVQPR